MQVRFFSFAIFSRPTHIVTTKKEEESLGLGCCLHKLSVGCQRDECFHTTSYPVGSEISFADPNAAGTCRTPNCCNAEIKSACGYRSTPPIRLQGGVLNSAQGRSYLVMNLEIRFSVMQRSSYGHWFKSRVGTERSVFDRRPSYYPPS